MCSSPCIAQRIRRESLRPQLLRCATRHTYQHACRHKQSHKLFHKMYLLRFFFRSFSLCYPLSCGILLMILAKRIAFSAMCAFPGFVCRDHFSYPLFLQPIGITPFLHIILNLRSSVGRIRRFLILFLHHQF